MLDPSLHMKKKLEYPPWGTNPVADPEWVCAPPTHTHTHLRQGRAILLICKKKKSGERRDSIQCEKNTKV